MTKTTRAQRPPHARMSRRASVLTVSTLSIGAWLLVAAIAICVVLGLSYR